MINSPFTEHREIRGPQSYGYEWKKKEARGAYVRRRVAAVPISVSLAMGLKAVGIYACTHTPQRRVKPVIVAEETDAYLARVRFDKQTSARAR